MAYASDESGRSEVYVGAFPAPGARSRVSTDGGSDPRWRRDGKELFYQFTDGTLLAADVKADTTFTVSAPRALFKMNIADRGAQINRGDGSSYVPTGNGQRFLINALIEEPPPSPVTVILHWPAALRR
jgi:hypothetical protein